MAFKFNLIGTSFDGSRMSRGTHHLKCMNPNWNCFRNMHHLRIFLKSFVEHLWLLRTETHFFTALSAQTGDGQYPFQIKYHVLLLLILISTDPKKKQPNNFGKDPVQTYDSTNKAEEERQKGAKNNNNKECAQTAFRHVFAFFC